MRLNLSNLVVLAGICLCFSHSVVNADLLTDLQGYWQFNSNGNDSSGAGRDMDIIGGPGYGTGLIGDALSLNGNANQFAQRPSNDTVFDVGGDDFTFQVWVKFNFLNGEQTLFEKFTGGAGPGYTLTKLSNNSFQFFSQGAGSAVSGVAPLNTVDWHQIAMRRSGSNYDIFLNGNSIIQNTASGSVTPSTNPLLIGRREGAQLFPVRGLMDEVAFWDRGLSDAEIGQLYNGGNGLDLVAIPEPTAIPLLALFGILAARRRRKC